MIEKILELLYTIRAFSAKRIWGCSSPGRAIRSQRIGSQFESDHLHHAKGYPTGYPFCVAEIFARSARRVCSHSGLFRARVRARAKPDAPPRGPLWGFGGF